MFELDSWCTGCLFTYGMEGAFSTLYSPYNSLEFHGIESYIQLQIGYEAFAAGHFCAFMIFKRITLLFGGVAAPSQWRKLKRNNSLQQPR
ncbi:hypothetical protein Csa_023173 [Cucumis sativus]|uniref:Uncharacterized protein n=1 Tax=Cucumis sativus TaxID=3659 RepID=A0A0A0LYI2_CUCSA|nr:hypothetical protein Csa_023173 [Cucumis sativus]